MRSGLAERWIDDGFILIGDAAHVASPIGAEGNNLEIQDAVAAHRILTPTLRDGDGPVPHTILRRIERARRPVVERTIERQRSQGRGLSRLLSLRERLPEMLEPTLLRGGAALMSVVAQLPDCPRAEKPDPSVEQTLLQE